MRTMVTQFRFIDEIAERSIFYLLIGLVLIWPVAAGAQTGAGQTGGMKMDKMGMKPHMDHNSKHGGVFFMALDEMHHLEGVLEPPGIFRVYVYDEYTKPLAEDKMKEVSGTVQMGEAEDAPKNPLKLSKDGHTMEMALPPGTKLPVTLTMLMRFPRMAADARPELFTFQFNEFTKPVHSSSSSSGQKPHHDSGGM
jgi:hypothetical protein